MNRLFTTAGALAGFAGLVVVAVATPSYAQDPGGTSLPAETQDATAPVLKTHPSPQYPPQALHDRLEGTVGLELKIGEDGTVESVIVRQPAGHGFDEAAVRGGEGRGPSSRPGAGTQPLRSTLQLSLPFTLPGAGSACGGTAHPCAPRAGGPAATDGAGLTEQRGADQSTLVIAERAAAAGERGVRLEHEPRRADAPPALPARRT